MKVLSMQYCSNYWNPFDPNQTKEILVI